MYIAIKIGQGLCRIFFYSHTSSEVNFIKSDVISCKDTVMYHKYMYCITKYIFILNPLYLNILLWFWICP
jgi:hypothetical protein